MTGHYVYRYMHPDYPWLYVGKTVNLEERIKSHDSSSGDNIPREFEPLLKESVVLYLELKNSLQETYIEKMLIDKYKPFLNKADKNEEDSPIDFVLPKWKKYIRKYDVDSSTSSAGNALLARDRKLNSVKNKEEKIMSEIKDVESKIKDAKKSLEQKKNELETIYSSIERYDIKIPKVGSFNEYNCSYIPTKEMKSLEYEEIEEFFKRNPNSSTVFVSSGYNIFGDVKNMMVSKEGLLLSEDDGEKVPLSSPIASFSAIASLHFGGWFPSDRLGWVALKNMYSEKLNQENDLLASLKTNLKEFIDFVSKKFGTDDMGFLNFIGYDSLSNEYALLFDCHGRYKSEHTPYFRCSINRKTNIEYGIEDEPKEVYTKDTVVNYVLSLPSNISWYKDNLPISKNFPYAENRKKLENKIYEIDDTIRLIDEQNK